MKKLFTIILAVACFTASAQTEYPYPYNPDGNNDGFVSLNDLLDLLAIFGSEYYSGVLATDSISAIMYTGELDYWDCTSSCVALTGNWKVLDHYLVGSYRNEILDAGAQGWWLDHKAFGNDGYAQFWRLANQGNPDVLFTEPSDPYVHHHCYCQTRTRGDIEDLNLCENELDECGVCGGDGAVYDCGCESIPEGDCDCDGNQLDAVGVCGGDCLEDLDGDGVCDPVLGPCEGEDFVSYHGVDYPIVETADGRCWFAENLETSSYNDGEAIEFAPSENQWKGDCSFPYDWQDWHCCLAGNGQYSDLSALSNPYAASCGGQASNFQNLEIVPASGFLYNFQAVETGHLCPSGWSVPTAPEWQHLIDSYGAGLEATVALNSTYWLENNNCGTANAPVPVLEWDSSGMALAGRGVLNEIFGHWGFGYGDYWSSTLQNDDFQNKSAMAFRLGSPCGSIGNSSIVADGFRAGRSIRCIKDTE